MKHHDLTFSQQSFNNRSDGCCLPSACCTYQVEAGTTQPKLNCFLLLLIEDDNVTVDVTKLYHRRWNDACLLQFWLRSPGFLLHLRLHSTFVLPLVKLMLLSPVLSSSLLFFNKLLIKSSWVRCWLLLLPCCQLLSSLCNQGVDTFLFLWSHWSFPT